MLERQKHQAYLAAKAKGMSDSEFEDLLRKVELKQSQHALDSLIRIACCSNEKPEEPKLTYLP